MRGKEVRLCTAHMQSTLLCNDGIDLSLPQAVGATQLFHVAAIEAAVYLIVTQGIHQTVAAGQIIRTAPM